MTAIYKRELKSYFQSMTGYVLIAFLVIFTGIYFMAYNLNSGYPYFSYVLMNINYVFLCGGTEEQDRPASACRTGKII